MIDETNALEERELLQQIASLGVGYRCYRPAPLKTYITDAIWIHSYILRMPELREYSDIGDVILESLYHIENGDDGYYLLDLHKDCIFAKGQHSVKDVIIGFTFSGTDDLFFLRRKKWGCFHDTGFLITPNKVYFLGMSKTFIPVSDFHMMSFISPDDNSKSGFVVDYDETQNNRPLVLLPCEENNDIIQSQLDYDDRFWREQYKSLHRKYKF